MISYVECLGGEGAGPGVASRCWTMTPDDERDELLPRKMAALQPKTEGSLRRRLLSAKIHQHHDAIWGPGDRKPLPPHLQPSSPWFRPQNLPPRPHVHPSFAPEAHGKLFLAPESHGKPLPQPPLQLQRPSCPVLGQRRRTSFCPPTPEPRPGYALPVPSPLRVPSGFREPEVPPQYRYRPSRRHRTGFLWFKRQHGRSSGQEARQTTPLLLRADGDSRWSVHYTTQKPRQGLRFIPGRKRSGSADDLQACPGPTRPRPHSPSLEQSEGGSRRRWRDKGRKMVRRSAAAS